MRSSFLFSIAVAFVINLQAQRISGFSDAEATKQLNWEKQFDAAVKTTNLDEWMKFLTSRPHHLGSAKGKENAEYIAKLFRSWGYDVAIESYDVLFPTPKTRLLEMGGPKPFRAKLAEEVLSQDRTSSQTSEQLPAYNAYSADGDVNAPLVFVNRGVPEDYEVLKKYGIDVKGKIVIAKYGGSWRGIKPKVAAENGAIGCIIYSDPQDDGYVEGDVYPEGAYKPASGVQRGSVMDMPVRPGDPLTPGYASVKEAKRLTIAEAPTLMKIPVIPISYEDALPLLKSLGGPVVPASWRGGLPITYHMGEGKQNVRLKLQFNWENKTLYNVVAKLKGTQFPDEWIIRGNHHDAWVNGATDPVSGIVSEMEEARVIGELVKNGMKLKRTLVYCAWDGEEQGLLGSVEWAEHHAEELRKKAVVYVNSDAVTRGFLHAGGSHSLENFMNEIAEQVKDPQTGVSIKQRYYSKRMADLPRTAVAGSFGNKRINLSALGAGSDWSGFLQHLGIASLNISFGGEGNGGEYHSIYDSYDHFVRFKDPGFVYGGALASTCGRIMMRMANAELLPFNSDNFSETVSGYVDEVKNMLGQMRVATETENRLVADSLLYFAEDPLKRLKPTEKKEPVPFLDFSKLENALAALKKSSSELMQQTAAFGTINREQARVLNTILFELERQLLTDNGLPRRPWYRHQVYAPGLYTGYGVKTLPGIREAVEQRQWKEAQENIIIVARVLENYTTKINEANKLLHK